MTHKEQSKIGGEAAAKVQDNTLLLQNGSNDIRLECGQCWHIATVGWDMKWSHVMSIFKQGQSRTGRLRFTQFAHFTGAQKNSFDWMLVLTPLHDRYVSITNEKSIETHFHWDWNRTNVGLTRSL